MFPDQKFFWAPKHLKPNNDFEEAHVFTCFCRKYVYIARQIPQIHIFQISMFIFPWPKNTRSGEQLFIHLRPNPSSQGMFQKHLRKNEIM